MKPKCHAVQTSDQMTCKCGNVWDMGDEGPDCQPIPSQPGNCPDADHIILVEEEKIGLEKYGYIFDDEFVFYRELPHAWPAVHTRSTKELAEASHKNMARMLRLDALMRQLEPDWVADWSDETQMKYSFYCNHISNKYRSAGTSSGEHVGLPYCSKSTSEKILELLNSGRFSLDGDE